MLKPGQPLKRKAPLRAKARCPCCRRPASQPTDPDLLPNSVWVCFDPFHPRNYIYASKAPGSPRGASKPKTAPRSRKPLRKQGARSQRERPALEAFRKAVLERAGGACERCGSRKLKPLHAHHMLRRPKADGRHDPKLGAALCTPCHDAIHAGSPDSKLWLVSTKPGRA